MERIIDFGRTHKGETLSQCPESYLKWLASHESNLLPENRWASRLARELLEREAQTEKLAECEARKEAEMAIKIAEQLVRANQGVRSNLNTSRAFSLMR